MSQIRFDVLRILSLAYVFLSCCSNALSTVEIQSSKILVVGASGGTGLRALNGLLDVGYAPSQIRVMSRNSEKPLMVKLRGTGFDTCQADLNEDSPALIEACSSCTGCYIHSTSSDTQRLDRGEEERARRLLRAILKQGGIKHIVFNSSAGETNHGNERITQKHNIETVFFKGIGPTVKFTSLRANLFMEELWKKYTRPAILKGNYPFGVPSDRQVYLTSVRDMGRLAGACLKSSGTTGGRIINVAGDVLTAEEIASAFATAQNSPCRHKQTRLLRWISFVFFRDLYQIIRFYRRSTETTDISSLQKEFPNLVTTFPKFLEETDWKNADLTFDNMTSTLNI